MNSNPNRSAAEKEEIQKRKPKDELAEEIETLKKINKVLVDQNVELKKHLQTRDTSDPSDVERGFKRLGIQENIVVEYYEREKELESLKAKFEMLEKSNISLKEENRKLSKELELNKKLNEKSKNVAEHNVKLQLENLMLKEQLVVQNPIGNSSDIDSLDGVNKPDEKNLSHQVEPFELKDFHNPYNCKVSCVPSVVHFVFFKMKLHICNKRFMMEMQCTLSEVSGEVPKVENCSLSFQDFYNVGLIEKEPVFFQKIKSSEEIEIQKAIESVDGEYPALFKMDYKENKDGTKSAGHCIALFPGGLFIDVQKRRYWQPKPNELEKVNRIEVWKIQAKAAKEWAEKCGLKKCELECTICIPDHGE